MGTTFAKFGNIKYTAGWSMNYQPGLSPSVCMIRTIPHTDTLEVHSDLILGESDRGQLTIRDCLLTSPTLTEDRKWELPILDRRWKWAFGKVDGIYNIP